MRRKRLRRCVCVIDGFYEWKQEGRKKIPRYCSLGDKRPMLIAALCARLDIPDAYRRAWEEDGTRKRLPPDLRTFTMVTRSAVGDMRSLHHRQPLVLTEETARLWLDDGEGEKEGVPSLLSSSPSPPPPSSSSSSSSLLSLAARTQDGSVESVVAAAASTLPGTVEAGSAKEGAGVRATEAQAGARATEETRRNKASAKTKGTSLVDALVAALSALDATPNPLPLTFYKVSEEVNSTRCQVSSLAEFELLDENKNAEQNTYLISPSRALFPSRSAEGRYTRSLARRRAVVGAGTKGRGRPQLRAPAPVRAADRKRRRERRQSDEDR